jgi:hypothetical protein
MEIIGNKLEKKYCIYINYGVIHSSWSKKDSNIFIVSTIFCEKNKSNSLQEA